MISKKNLKTGLFFIPVVFAIGISFTIYQFHSGIKKLEAGLDDHYETIASANKMLSALEGENSSILMIINGYWDSGRKSIELYDSLFFRGYKLAQISVYDEETKAIVYDIEKQYSNLTRLWFKPILGDDNESTIDWYKNKYKPKYEELKYLIEQFQFLAEDNFYNLSERYSKIINQWFIPLYISLFISIIFIVFIAFSELKD